MRIARQKTISDQLIKQMCMMVFGDDRFSKAKALTAGQSHQNLSLILATGQQVVLRVGDDKKNLHKQYALAQKLWQKLPVPRFLSNILAANGQRYFAFLEFKRGQCLDNVEKLPAADQAQLGFELGEYLALIHSQTFITAGQFSADLKISKTYDASPDGLSKLFTEHLSKAVTNGYISVTKSQKLSHAFAVKIPVLGEWQHAHCLIHNDLNENNIWQYDGHISAILDWQHTLSGHPAMDFAKFTRTPYINCPIFLENLCDSYYLTHKSLPANWDDIAEIVDMLTWAEALSHPQLHDSVRNNAISKLKSILRG